MQCKLCTSPILCTVFYAVQSPSPRDSSLWEPCIELVRKQRGHLRETKIYIFPFVFAKTIKKFTQIPQFMKNSLSHQSLRYGRYWKAQHLSAMRSGLRKAHLMGHNEPTAGFMGEGASKHISSNLFVATRQKYVVSGWKSVMLRGLFTKLQLTTT